MRWLRLLLYCLPLVLAAGVYYFLSGLGFREFAADGPLTFAISSEPLGLDPLPLQDPVSEEIEALVYDRLIGRGPDLELEAHLAESWRFAQRISYFFSGEREAREAWGGFSEARGRWPKLGIADAALEGDTIVVDLPGHSFEAADVIAHLLPPEHLSAVTTWALGEGEPVAAAARDFAAGPFSQGWQVRRVRMTEDGTVEVVSAGNTEAFEREFSAYLASNAALGANLRLEGRRGHLVERSMRLELRPAARWHDGRPVTAADVVHSITVARESGYAPVVDAALREIESVAVAGPLTVEFKFRRPFATVLEFLERLPVVPAHAPHAFSPRMDEVPPAGTGPFRVSSWREGGSIVLERNEDHYRGRPQNERIVYERVIEDRLRRIFFEIEAIDAYTVAPRDYGRIEGQEEYEVARGPRVHLTAIAWNSASIWFEDARVRRALAQGLDRAGLNAELLDGHGAPAGWGFHPAAPFDPPNPLPPMARDRERAGELLDEAGWSERRFGTRHRSSQAFAFRLSVVSGDAYHRDLARALQREWRALDVQAQIRPITYAELSRIRAGQEDFDALLFETRLPHHLDQFDWWHSSQVGAGNFARIEDEALDEVLEAIRRTQTDRERERLAKSLQVRLSALQPWTPVLLHDEARVFHRDRVFVGESPGGGRRKREVGANQVGLTSDLAWWVNRRPDNSIQDEEPSGAAGKDETR